MERKENPGEQGRKRQAGVEKRKEEEEEEESNKGLAGEGNVPVGTSHRGTARVGGKRGKEGFSHTWP